MRTQLSRRFRHIGLVHVLHVGFGKHMRIFHDVACHDLKA